LRIEDIFDRILLRSGQFILRKSRIDIDIDSFRILVEDALSEYSGFVPYEKPYTMDFNSQRNFTFPDGWDTDLNRSPDWIAEATPINSFGSINTILNYSGSPQNALIDPIQAPWDYNKVNKTLTVPYSAFYKVVACYEHEIVSEVIDGVTVYSVPTIDRKDQPFFDLLKGMFLQGIGRSRRAFTLNDLPILMDAETLASEGDEIMERALEGLQADQKFYLAFGG